MRFSCATPRFTALGLLLVGGATAMAAPVTRMQVHQAVSTWLQRTPTPLRTPLPADITGIETHTDADGTPLFHEVRLAPEGFVIVAPDDLLEPVIAFSASGTLEKNPENHLYLLLKRDLRTRMAHISSSWKGKAPHLAQATTHKTQAKWQALMGNADTTSASTIDDVRVAPLIESKWNQSTAGGYLVYNYFTPNNYVCGCVATAMSQLMRFHSFPTTGIGVHSFPITVDKVSKNLITRGGDGSGGAYDWSMMPLVPSPSSSDAERQMIGSLCYDAGLSVKMSYASDGSGAYSSNVPRALKSTFQYANAVLGYNGAELTGNGLAEMVQPNLDAGLPVLFGISGDGGHSIVCDGYGYTGATLYHHLNMGWSGKSDAWYNLPDIGTSYNFNAIDECIYNVFKNGTGEILSGRITDGSGNPVADVKVTNGSVTSTTNAKGIYALKGLTAGIQTITASKSGLSFPSSVRLMGTSTDHESVGNVWGVDLVQGTGATPTIFPQPLSQDVKLGSSTTFAAGATGVGPLSFHWTKNGAAVGSDNPIYTLDNASAADDQASIAVHVTGGLGFTDSTATLSVVRLFNGDFEKGNKGWNLFNDGVVQGPTSYDEVTPHGGNRWLCIGDWDNPCTDYAVQDITLPDISTIDLSFSLGIANKKATPTTASNTFRVKILDTNDQELLTLKSLNNTNSEVNGAGKVIWKTYGPFDLTPWKGKTIRLRFESQQTGGADTGTIFAVDDVELRVSNGSSFDITKDSNLDVYDLLEFLKRYDSTLPSDLLKADFNGDGRINDSDLNILLNAF